VEKEDTSKKINGFLIFAKFAKDNVIWLAFVGIVLFVTAVAWFIRQPPLFFLSVTNITILFNQMSIVGILTVGVMFPILSRGIDLSTSAVVAVTATLSATLVSDVKVNLLAKLPPELSWLGILIVVFTCLAVGALVGAFNGSLVAYTKIHPFVATLGSTLILKGVANLITNAAPVGIKSDAFKFIGSGKIIPGVPLTNQFFWLVIVIIIGGFLLTQTRFGSNVFAIGGNEVAAKVAGIRVERNIVWVYIWCSCCAALGGLLYTASTGAGTPTAGIAGSYELDAIAAATVGGTSQTGGVAKINGVICGILILAVINNALGFLNITPYIQWIIKGCIIIGAVVFDMRKNAKKV
jgi:ribose/xylose/arabinose/galactoside ABC-type transport system permease subunit